MGLITDAQEHLVREALVFYGKLISSGMSEDEAYKKVKKMSSPEILKEITIKLGREFPENSQSTIDSGPEESSEELTDEIRGKGNPRNWAEKYY